MSGFDLLTLRIHYFFFHLAIRELDETATHTQSVEANTCVCALHFYTQASGGGAGWGVGHTGNIANLLN